MEPRGEPSVDEQRRSERVPSDEDVLVRIETDELRAVGDNVSDAGILLLAGDPVRVTVTTDSLGERAGRLVRVQNMGDGRWGLAVEFDPA